MIMKVGLVYKNRAGSIVYCSNAMEDLFDVQILVYAQADTDDVDDVTGYNVWKCGHRQIAKEKNDQDIIEELSKEEHPEYYL